MFRAIPETNKIISDKVKKDTTNFHYSKVFLATSVVDNKTPKANIMLKTIS
jgi:hypothetical protein